jgi:hypothetical protein
VSRLQSVITMLLVCLAVVYPASGSICHACTCGVALSFEQKVAQADAIFSGTVVGMWYSRERTDAQFEFEVDHVWKGNVGTTVRVVSNVGSQACGFDYVQGQKYVVFKNANGSTTTCMGTKPFSDLEKWEESLGKPSQTYPHDSSVSAATNKVKVTYNNIELIDAWIDTRERALMPLTAEWFTALGIENQTDQKFLSEIRLRKDKKILEFQLGSNLMAGEKGLTYMSTIATSEADTQYIPLRYALEALGYKVIWNDKDLSLTLVDNKEEPSH